VGAAAEDEAASMVAEQEKGGEIRAAVAQGAGEMAAKKAEQHEKTAAEHAKGQAEIGRLEQTHAEQEAQEKIKAKVEVKAQREQWTKEQRDLVTQHKAEATAKAQEARGKIGQESKQAEQQAAAHHRQGAEEAEQARRQGEREAKAEQDRGQKESGGGGFFGWIGSKVSSFFESIKNGIKAAFDRARAAVKSAIQKAQQLATAVIDRAVAAVTSIIRAVGSVLIAIGDRLLAAFPGLRDRFRRAIQGVVQAAEAAVNRLAERLKANIKKALDMIGKAIDAVLSLYEKAYLAIVDAVKGVVMGAINWAKKAIAALGVFAALVKDIAAAPGAWLSRLGAGIVDGIKNHLWKALKQAVTGWFNQKVEEVVGFGKAIFNLLKKGGINLVQVGKMVWQGIVSALPQMIVMLLVEKLVSMIVPAAGAVLLIIQGLQAAWGAIQRVLSAIDAFVTFLKAVKSGKSGPQFAAALAASAIAVIEFIAVWLLRKLKGAAKGVGSKLKGIAQRIGARLKAVGKAIAGGAKRAAGAIKRGVQAAGRAIVKGAKAIGRGIAKGAAWVVKKSGRVGQAIKRGYQKLKKKLQEWKKKFKEWNEKRKAKAKASAEDRKTKALEALDAALATNQLTGLRLRAYLVYLKLRYRLKTSRFVGDEEGGEVTFAASKPKTRKVKTKSVRPPEYGGLVKIIAVKKMSTDLDPDADKLIGAAARIYKACVEQEIQKRRTAKKKLDWSAIGTAASNEATSKVLKWAKRNSIPGVLGETQLGKPHGKVSSDGQYWAGSLIFDFKLSRSTLRRSQHKAFIAFCAKNDLRLVYIAAR
jgi:phage-related protein